MDVGNLIQVASQTGILTITQDKPIAAVFTLPEEDELVQVQDAMSRETKAGGAVQVSVFDSGNTNKLAQGVLLTPNNTIDTTTGTISLRAMFDNTDDHLWAGPVHQCARLGEHAQERGHHPGTRRRTRPQRAVRLHGRCE